MVLRPMGSWVLRRWIQWNSIRSLRVLPKSLLGWACMKSTMWIFISSPPWCPGPLKCLPISVFWDPPMSVQWPPNLPINLLEVWPTYCFWHTLHVIQYIKLLDLQVTVFLAVYSCCVYVLFIRPVFSSAAQYLHVLRVQLFAVSLNGFEMEVSPFFPLGLILAWTRISLKFFVLLKPITNLDFDSSLVVDDHSKIPQVRLTILVIGSQFG